MTFLLVDDIGLEPMTFRTSSDGINLCVLVFATGGKYVVRICTNGFLHIMQIGMCIAGSGLDIGVAQDSLRTAHILVGLIG